jgi:GH15 family glucan-1,4-alpha-glucosidase
MTISRTSDTADDPSQRDPAQGDAAQRDPALRDLVASSIELIEGEQAATGAYPACSSFSVYGHAWLRDGSFVADGLSRQGRAESPAAFHDWVNRVVTARRDRIDAIVAAAAAKQAINPAHYLPTRYTLLGEEGSEGWWDFQLDGYGTWLWAVRQHVQRHGEDAARYEPGIELTVRYLCALWPTPCYDWWEEHIEQVHLSTLVSIWAGLQAALELDCLSDSSEADASRAVTQIADIVATQGIVDGRLRKWLGSTEVDGSLLSAVAPFAVVDEAVAKATVAAVEADIVRDHGVHRYRADVFYGGGRWPVLAGLLGEAYLRLRRRDDAVAQLRWIAGTADDAGHLPEQVSDWLLAPESFQPWVDRWGAVARPLLWSHAAYLSLAGQLGICA